MAKWQGNRFVSGRSRVRSPLPALLNFFFLNITRSCGLMDKALPSGGRDCGFESRLELAQFCLFFANQIIVSVAGVMVSIAAFQAVDPGSIPGPRKFLD